MVTRFASCSSPDSPTRTSTPRRTPVARSAGRFSVSRPALPMKRTRLVALAVLLAGAARFSFAQHAHADTARFSPWSWDFTWSATGLYVNEGTKRGARQFALSDFEALSVTRSESGRRFAAGITTTL